jgi:hypothetical protein
MTATGPGRARPTPWARRDRSRIGGNNPGKPGAPRLTQPPGIQPTAG